MGKSPQATVRGSSPRLLILVWGHQAPLQGCLEGSVRWQVGNPSPRAQPPGASQPTRVSTFISVSILRKNSWGPYTFWPWGLTSGSLF